MPRNLLASAAGPLLPPPTRLPIRSAPHSLQTLSPSTRLPRTATSALQEQPLVPPPTRLPMRLLQEQALLPIRSATRREPMQMLLLMIVRDYLVKQLSKHGMIWTLSPRPMMTCYQARCTKMSWRPGMQNSSVRCCSSTMMSKATMMWRKTRSQTMPMRICSLSTLH